MKNMTLQMSAAPTQSLICKVKIYQVESVFLNRLTFKMLIQVACKETHTFNTQWHSRNARKLLTVLLVGMC